MQRARAASEPEADHMRAPCRPPRLRLRGCVSRAGEDWGPRWKRRNTTPARHVVLTRSAVGVCLHTLLAPRPKG